MCPKSLYLLRFFEINDILHFRQNSRLWPKIGKVETFQRTSGVVLSTLRVQNVPEIPLSLTVFEINDIFHFRQNSRWWPKIVKV